MENKKNIPVYKLAEDIPNFDGNNISVDTFLSSIQTAECLCQPQQEMYLINMIKEKVYGPVKQKITGKHFKSISHLLRVLENFLVAPWDYQYYYKKLNNTTMKENEPVILYTRRIKLVLSQISVALEDNYKGTSLIEQKIELSRRILNAYVNGLIEELRDNVYCSSPATFDDALKYAKDAEIRRNKHMKFLTPIPSNSAKTFMSKNERIRNILKLLSFDKLCPMEREHILDIVSTFHEIFFLPGDLLGSVKDFELEIATSDEKPVFKQQYSNLYNNSKLNEEVKKLLHKRFIVPSISEYNSPIIVRPKKNDSTQLRIVLNYQDLNEKILNDNYPIPRIEDHLHIFKGAKYFSVFDLVDATYQIKIRPDDCKKTAFTTSIGHFEFVRFPTGLKNGSSTLQAIMDKILHGLQGKECFAYIDDIIVASSTISNHLLKTKILLQRLKNAGFSISTQKCKFLHVDVIYLGYRITTEGIGPDPQKIEKISKYQMPKTHYELKLFVNLICCLQRFVPDYAERAKPLHDLLKAGARSFEWNNEHQKSFLDLKGYFRTKIIQRYPDLNKPFLLKIKTYNETVSAYLHQVINKVEVPIAYLSRELKPGELEFIPPLKECIALEYAFNRFQTYIQNRNLSVVMDENSFIWLNAVQNPTQKVESLREAIASFPFHLVHDKTANCATEMNKTEKTNAIASSMEKEPNKIELLKPLEIVEDKINDDSSIENESNIIEILKPLEIVEDKINDESSIEEESDETQLLVPLEIVQDKFNNESSIEGESDETELLEPLEIVNDKFNNESSIEGESDETEFLEPLEIVKDEINNESLIEKESNKTELLELLEIVKDKINNISSIKKESNGSEILELLEIVKHKIIDESSIKKESNKTQLLEPLEMVKDKINDCIAFDEMTDEDETILNAKILQRNEDEELDDILYQRFLNDSEIKNDNIARYFNKDGEPVNKTASFIGNLCNMANNDFIHKFYHHMS